MTLRTIDRARMERVLELHARAYELWIWIASEALHDPTLLSREAEAAIAHPARCADWLRELEPRLPRQLVVASEHRAAFAALVSSFLHTSFHVERLEWNGRVVDAQLRRGPGHAGPRAAKRARHGGSATREALHRLCRDEGMKVAPEVLRAVARAGSIQDELVLWTYAVGLVARSEGSGEGAEDWERWRDLDRETRKKLDVAVIWAARERLLVALRERVQNDGVT
ncbi:hypothetical protein [Sandaracinus amylolyticus]|uniref:hypothetical protein n=1 Tax=Sandaracinus amylolyticus TaxID=927083 RepID=UPI001F2723F1|nr:hypothetical protein [Sandaracinus amylolyticus]UJR86461.1 Hypothetical protein I5071_85560 [Sandaracinus amylolyticus]